ncbi:hypothetical protein [Priestia megaterium]|uniref:hypothetical protein n=1 Tax=Priestia megaterium TaxID=1404 RepID=UPI002E20059D|nr:hypothetical protein [Priestia megaterium]
MNEKSFPMAGVQEIKADQEKSTKKFFIRYHIVGNKVVTDIQEFKNFGEAIARTSKRLENRIIGIVKDGDHVIEINTKYITHHEVMSEEVEKERKKIETLVNFSTNIHPNTY